MFFFSTAFIIESDKQVADVKTPVVCWLFIADIIYTNTLYACTLNAFCGYEALNAFDLPIDTQNTLLYSKGLLYVARWGLNEWNITTAQCLQAHPLTS